MCPAAQVTCVEKSPEAFVYLEKNCRCALKGQGGQTEDLLQPAAFEQEAAPAFDWGPALNALRAKAKPAYAVEPVQGDLFTYWKSAPEGELDLIVQSISQPRLFLIFQVFDQPVDVGKRRVDDRLGRPGRWPPRSPAIAAA